MCVLERPRRSDLEPRSRVRPIRPGVSFGLASRAGTLGLVVVPRDDPGRLLLLSSSHVLNLRPDGRAYPLFQPAGRDRADGDPPVAWAFRYVRLHPTVPNRCEAGLALPLDAGEVEPAPAWGPVRAVCPRLEVGMRLWKAGRTTGLVQGVVEAVGWGGFVRLGARRYPFAHQVVVRGLDGPVSLLGDSGSVWFTEDGEPAAMNFAGSEQGLASISTPLPVVLDRLGVRLAEGAP